MSLNGSAGSIPSSAFMGTSLKNVPSSRIPSRKISSTTLRAVSEYDEEKQTEKDRWAGLAYDVSDDQQDITRGKGIVDSLFQAPQNAGTHYAVMSSYEYISTGIKK